MSMVFLVLIVALAFEYINGFHDTANAIATTVSTKVLTPREAVMLASVFNLVGALSGTAVASTIGNGLVDVKFVTLSALGCALLSGIVWNLATWWLGLPSSSSHALIGGLCGSVLAAAHGNWNVIRWSIYHPTTHAAQGLWPKVIVPMLVSPLVGLLAGFGIMAILLFLLRKRNPYSINRVFGKFQLLSASWMSFSHGTNDAQKTMGIMALTLFTATQTGAFTDLPSWLGFLKCSEFHVPAWVKVICALTMAAGTAGGGWRIIKTVGQKLVRMQPIHGFAAQTTAATVIQFATHWGIPLSTTHVISASIMGVGATKRLNAVKWGVVGHMVWAWVLTLPITAFLGCLFSWILQLCGWK